MEDALSNASSFSDSQETDTNLGSSEPAISSASVTHYQNNRHLHSNHEESISHTKEGKQDPEYLADIKPLQFKMVRDHSREADFISGEQHRTNDRESKTNAGKKRPTLKSTDSDELFSKVKAQLHQGPDTASNRFSAFNFIDMDQFEDYLREPSYIKTLNRSKTIKQFRRLFLAQELKVPDDSDYIGKHYSGHVENGRLAIASSNNGRPRSTLQTDSPVLSPKVSAESAARSKAVWTSKFSLDGRYMSVGGKDGGISLWKVLSSPVERWELQSTLESQSSMLSKALRLTTSPSSSPRISSAVGNMESHSINKGAENINLYGPVFNPNPTQVFREHGHDVLSLDWSKNNFLISGSMDTTVKLWHPDRKTSLKTFPHPDFVTSVVFHPNDDRFFVSGCLDHKCRIWSILDNEVTYEFDCRDLITSVAISPGPGKYTVVGTFNGYVHVLLTRGLEHVGTFHVTDTRTQSIHSKAVFPSEFLKTHKGPRVTGIECFISPTDKSLRALISCNDSRVRIFDLERQQMIETLKGLHTEQASHKAHLYTRNGKPPLVVSSSDDSWIYAWNMKSYVEPSSQKQTDETDAEFEGGSAQGRPLNMTRSGNFRKLINKSLSRSSSLKNMKDYDTDGSSERHHVLGISSTKQNPHTIKNSRYICFHAHRNPITTAIIAPTESSKLLSLSNDFICELCMEFSDRNSASAADKKYSSLADGANGESGVFNAVNAIGTILISTDASGTIRVFRSDIPTRIRNRVLQKLQESNLESHRHAHSSASLSSLSRNNSFHGSISSMMRAHSYSSLPHLTNTARSNMGSRCSFSKPRASLSRSPSCNSHKDLFHGTLTPIYSGSKRDLTVQPNGTVSPLTLNDSHHNLSALVGYKCDVCQGTSFAQTSKRGQGKRDSGAYFCQDCGTVLNNFR
ncbi:Laf1p KNAG_0E02400 [Huiozyma naganishii CBS 8797]|uniref:Uncharacterized protein n=1 Tax=Huiozyma naganishii (strain ATCC MYA-139 / BCRC 22969 / CBS 8797 / KCTC 17520 / NBRC 10181 / NCYC 3082 / Yp74L-3) TaxID=1071383 RepID=J7S7U7_HUIN7|nr:hypothetical protein KNAG_0E02400 [Kazachstania naganishii CBS 8797]CCK70501.1 hypothetical protein KNAG_0E02400 [Kazachstania naganishii CBS 8797]